MTLLLGFDFETTGVDVEKDDIIEYAFVLYDSKRKIPVMIASGLVKTEKEITAEITELTGITKEDTEKYGAESGIVAQVYQYLTKTFVPDYLVAHNGNRFDIPLLVRELNTRKVNLPKLPVIDTMTDLPFSPKMQTRKLSYLAAELGFLNPFAHRALFDVMTMMKVLDHYYLEDVIRMALSPTLLIQAQTSFAEKEKAKEAKFYWDGEKKAWMKQVKECNLEAEKNSWGFKWKIIEEIKQ